jgi:hypothetical protein
VQAYYGENSYANKTIAATQNTSASTALSNSWKNSIDGNYAGTPKVFDVLDANSDRRINSTGPDASPGTGDHAATFTPTRACNGTGDGTSDCGDNQDSSTNCASGGSGWSESSAALGTFNVPASGVSDDDGSGANDILGTQYGASGSYGSWEGGDENEIYYDGALPSSWRSSDAKNFWETTGNGGSGGGEDDTWNSGLLDHVGTPDAGNSYVQKACTGTNHEHRSQRIRGHERLTRLWPRLCR